MVKQRELELISSKNYLLPRLDAVGRYRWLGLGDRLIDSDNSVDNAYGVMTSGDFQSWHMGLDLTIPIGFRKEMAGVRYAQLNLARECAVLQEQAIDHRDTLSTEWKAAGHVSSPSAGSIGLHPAERSGTGLGAPSRKLGQVSGRAIVRDRA